MRVTLTTSSLILPFIFQLTTSTTFGQWCRAIEKEPWSYTGRTNGPYQWSQTYPMCGGNSQSPIDIFPYSTQFSNQYPVTIVGYDIPVTEAEFLNDGHTVQITPTDGQRRYIEIDGTQYNLTQFHFHWGRKLRDGTEHTFFYKSYAMEAHFVHSIDDDNIAVMGVLYKATSEPNETFEPIVNNFPEILYKDQITTFQGQINLNDFFPTDRAYYSYSGSLTTPPCTEGVNWSVFKSIQQVGRDQVMQFRQLYAVTEDEAEPGCRITTNVRPLQRVNGRPVYLYESTM